MRSKVGKWGNTLALRIPKAFAQEAGLVLNTPVELHLTSEGAIVVQAVSIAPVTLAEYLEKVTPQNLHSSMDFGMPIGREQL